MNLLMVNMYYYPNIIGGTENSIKLLAEALAKRGNKVIIYTLDAEIKSSNFIPETINGVSIYRGYSKCAYERWKYNKKNVYTIISNRVHFFYNKNTVSDISTIIKKEKIDLIHSNNLGSISLSVWKLAKDNNIPVVHTLRDYWLMDPSTIIGRSNIVIGQLHRMICRCFSNKYIEHVTAPSNRTLELFKNNNFFLNAKSECIVNSIQPNYKMLSTIVKEKNLRTDDNIKFLYVGNLLDNKGIDVLLDAFRLLDNKSITLTICGSGPEEKLVEKRAASDGRIIYKGRCTAEQVNMEYKKADVLIVPSRWEEPFGRIIIEGAQYGLPVIGSDRGGIPEVIATLKCGRLFDSNSVRDLVENINYFTSRAIIRHYMNNIPRRLNYYSLDKQIDSFEKIYYNILSSTM